MKSNKIFVAGHNGMVGSAVLNKLKSEGFNNIITKTRRELDLTKQTEVNKMFGKERPEMVVICAAKVGGHISKQH